MNDPDIWLCAGQSNMQFPLGECDDGERAVVDAGAPGLSLATVPEGFSATRVDGPPPAFEPSSPEGAASFSAVGYHFGRRLQEELGKPIALIGAHWDGTAIDGWTPEEAFHTSDVLEAVWQRWERYAADYVSGGPRLSQYPGRLFNAMIAPLTGIPIRGVIWYQGEGNCVRRNRYPRVTPAEYAGAFVAMIEAWRAAWGRDLPFIWVQLHGFWPRVAEPGESDWATLREAQAAALRLPGTGMASAVDLGDPEGRENHPRNKRTVAERLARVALSRVYGYDDVVCDGPSCSGVTREGGKLRLRFADAHGGLVVRGGAWPRGFAVAGVDGRFEWAKAFIEGREEVVVWADEVPEPERVRFAWAGNPDCNLYNGAGFPALPFRMECSQ